MKTNNITLQKLPGNPDETPQVFFPFHNPTNILSQQKADITTNTYIPNNNVSFQDINNNISDTFIDILDELLSKPNDIDWIKYIYDVCTKNNRLNYIAILLFLITIFIIFVKM